MTEPNLKTILDTLVDELHMELSYASEVKRTPDYTKPYDTALKAILSTHIPLSECEKIIGENEPISNKGTKGNKPNIAYIMNRNRMRAKQRLALKHLIEEKLK